jgi:hypothetical protein
VQLVRKDSHGAGRDAAENDLPSSHENITALITKFAEYGLDARDMSALSGARTVGMRAVLPLQGPCLWKRRGRAVLTSTPPSRSCEGRPTRPVPLSAACLQARAPPCRARLECATPCRAGLESRVTGRRREGDGGGDGRPPPETLGWGHLGRGHGDRWGGGLESGQEGDR